jgi:hypothetical protein
VSASTVNSALTPQRRSRLRRTVVENDDYAAFSRRILAAHGRRIAQGDIEGLADLAALSADVDTAIGTAVTGLRAAGFSWADIGSRLGTTRQAAQQRWGDQHRGDRP